MGSTFIQLKCYVDNSLDGQMLQILGREVHMQLLFAVYHG